MTRRPVALVQVKGWELQGSNPRPPPRKSARAVANALVTDRLLHDVEGPDVGPDNGVGLAVGWRRGRHGILRWGERSR
jgi:hypothetical protein